MKPDPIPTINPRYAGASAEDVARALLRPLSTTPRTARKTVRRDQIAAHHPSSDKRGDNDSHLR